MNNLIAGAAVRALLSVGGAYLSAKGIATSAEVSQFASDAYSLGMGAVSLGSALYGVYTRFTSKQIAMTESLKTVSHVVKKSDNPNGLTNR